MKDEFGMDIDQRVDNLFRVELDERLRDTALALQEGLQILFFEMGTPSEQYYRNIY